MSTGPIISRLDYKKPNEQTAPLGYASSIINGNTVNGGLRSLTYKSIYAHQLTEELDLARSAITGNYSADLLKIIDTPFVTEDYLNTLKQSSQQESRKITAGEELQKLNAQLEQEIQANGAVSEALASKIRGFASKDSTNLGATWKKITTNIPVARMEDTEGFDSSIYELSRQRREAEERKKLQEEQEKRELEQAQEQARAFAQAQAEAQAEAEAQAAAEAHAKMQSQYSEPLVQQAHMGMPDSMSYAMDQDIPMLPQGFPETSYGGALEQMSPMPQYDASYLPPSNTFPH